MLRGLEMPAAWKARGAPRKDRGVSGWDIGAAGRGRGAADRLEVPQGGT